MQHLAQKEINQFVSKIENSSNNLFDWQDHINECDFCSKRIEEALSFNVNLTKFLKADISPKVEVFVQKLQAHNKETFVAYPIAPMLHIPNKSFIVHLADSGTHGHDVQHKYQYIGSLITKQEDILVRVLKDNITKKTYLYLISDDEKKYQNKVVTLSNSNKKYHSDNHGKVNLGKIDLSDIENLTVTIKPK